MRILWIVIALAETPLLLGAQAACTLSPGVRFGIRAFQCPSCTVRQPKAGERVTYSFLSEPTVTETEPGSPFAPGDVIAAVDSLPITTDAGAEHFTYPEDGRHVVSVRRGQERRDIAMQLSGRCRVSSTNAPLDTVRRGQVVVIDTSVHAGYGSGHGGGGGQGVGVPVLGGEPMVIVNGQPVKATGRASQIGRFGFATECRPSCSTKRLANGRYVFVYDGYPVVAAIRPGSAADAAGLRVGDEIVAINGRSILADEALTGTDSRDDLHLIVRRAGKEITVTMRAAR